MQKEIKYIGFFESPLSRVERDDATAASSKMEYIISVFTRIGCNVKVISLLNSNSTKLRFYGGENIQTNEGYSLKYFPTFYGRWRLIQRLSILFYLLNLFIYLIFRAKRGETIVVYHSVGYLNAILWAKKIRGFKVILEVEEIYRHVTKLPRKREDLEHRMVASADAYIFSTELLNEKMNCENRPYVVVYGRYSAEPTTSDKFDDGRIHILYAGTLDRSKGVGFVISVAEYLPSNYHIHILGHGTELAIQDVERQIRQIRQISKITNCATISYGGSLKGQEYVSFIQKCHIGLSPQSSEALFNSSSFPSKILVYLSNGLCVVSTRIDAVYRSAIGGCLTYLEGQSPEDAAMVIMKIDMKKESNSHEIIGQLDRDLAQKLRKLLS